jgi:hypothetical protein
MRKYYFKILLILTFFPSCVNKPNIELPKEELYFRFRHIKEINNSAEPGLTRGYKLLEDTITNIEKTILIEILNEFGWKYKLTESNEVLIWQISLKDLNNLNYLDGELERRVESLEK